MSTSATPMFRSTVTLAVRPRNGLVTSVHRIESNATMEVLAVRSPCQSFPKGGRCSHTIIFDCQASAYSCTQSARALPKTETSWRGPIQPTKALGPVVDQLAAIPAGLATDLISTQTPTMAGPPMVVVCPSRALRRTASEGSKTYISPTRSGHRTDPNRPKHGLSHPCNTLEIKSEHPHFRSILPMFSGARCQI